MTEEDFLKSYNNGYLVAKYAPELAEILATAKGDTVQLQAFKEGSEKYKEEQSKEIVEKKHSSFFTDRKSTNVDKTKNKDIEPDR